DAGDDGATPPQFHGQVTVAASHIEHVAPRNVAEKRKNQPALKLLGNGAEAGGPPLRIDIRSKIRERSSLIPRCHLSVSYRGSGGERTARCPETARQTPSAPQGRARPENRPRR